jgi:hypothetical protein
MVDTAGSVLFQPTNSKIRPLNMVTYMLPMPEISARAKITEQAAVAFRAIEEGPTIWQNQIAIRWRTKGE